MKEEKTSCFWTLEKDNFDDEFYTTTCGHLFSFTVGNIENNKFNFCPYCGKEIKTDGI